MATNKKITQLDELTPATWADDDVIAIVDISAQETKKIQLSTFRGAVTGVSSLNASTPLTVDSATGDVTISVAINGGGTINAVFDEDNMSSNSPTALATQQSIKAYVDSQVGTVDTLAEILANGNTTGGTDIVVSSGDAITTNTISETTAASGVTIDSLLVKDGGITAAGTSTFAGQTITDLGAVTTADINGGTIDGTTIGGSSAAAGTFTTFTSTGIDDNAASTALTISSAGNVGIGTSSPSSLLHIASTGDAVVIIEADTDNVTESDNPQLRFVQDGGITTARIGFADGTNRMEFVNEVGDGIAFGTSDTERMRILGGGNVGIGTTSPAEKLEVTGNIILDATDADIKIKSGVTGTTGAVRWTLNTDSTSYADISLPYDTRATVGLLLRSANGYPITIDGGNGVIFKEDSTTETMRITSSGNVGIGTASPGTKLNVYTGSATNTFTRVQNTLGYIDIGPTSGGGIYGGYAAPAAATNYLLGTSNSNPILIYTNGSERMRIDSSGNVGIGTSAPDGKLDIATGGTTDVVAALGGTFPALTYRNGTGTWFHAGKHPSSDYFYIGRGATPTTNVDVVVDNSGNVGIGTTNPQATLNVSGQIRIDSNTTDPDDGAAYLFQQSGVGWNMASTAIAFTTGSSGARSERMRITSSGNVGIGRTSPIYKLEVDGSAALYAASTETRNLEIGYGRTGNGYSYVDLIGDATYTDYGLRIIRSNGGANTASEIIHRGTGSLAFSSQDAGVILLKTSNAERMRIDSSGNLLIGQTSDTSPGFNDTNTGGAWSSDGTSLHLSRNSNAVAWFNRNTTTGTVQSFRYNGSAVGSISVTASATAYNTSSDYRLKENVVDLSGAIDRVKLLKPSRFNFIADPDTTVDGFVAHEVSDIVPEAVHGEKDAVDEDGNPEYQGIDQSKLVPLLTAALQEALTKIDDLETRVAALETA